MKMEDLLEERDKWVAIINGNKLGKIIDED